MFCMNFYSYFKIKKKKNLSNIRSASMFLLPRFIICMLDNTEMYICPPRGPSDNDCTEVTSSIRTTSVIVR